MFALARRRAATIRGTITDSLGAGDSKARVELITNQKIIAATTADEAGRYEFRDVAASRYQVQATAPFSFDVRLDQPLYGAECQCGSASGDRRRLRRAVTVTATGTPTPEAQVGIPSPCSPRTRLRGQTGDCTKLCGWCLERRSRRSVGAERHSGHFVSYAAATVMRTTSVVASPPKRHRWHR